MRHHCPGEKVITTVDSSDPKDFFDPDLNTIVFGLDPDPWSRTGTSPSSTSKQPLEVD